MRGSVVLIAVSSGLALLVGIAWLGLPRNPSSDGAQLPGGMGGTTAREEELKALWDAFAAERKARTELALEVEWLREDLERLVASMPQAPPHASAPPPAGSEPESSLQPENVFDDSALVALGLSSEDARQLRERYEAMELKELYLRDRARREGWLHKRGYAAGVRRMWSDLRGEVGDERYDLMLYGAGRRNRVRLQPLHGSPAEQAGLKSGDVILRYDSAAILTKRDLVYHTGRGEPGTQVAVEIDRHGKRRRFYVPRGPLGARVERVRIPPGPG